MSHEHLIHEEHLEGETVELGSRLHQLIESTAQQHEQQGATLDLQQHLNGVPTGSIVLQQSNVPLPAPVQSLPQVQQTHAPSSEPRKDCNCIAALAPYVDWLHNLKRAGSDLKKVS